MMIRRTLSTSIAICISACSLIGCNVTITDGMYFNYKGKTAERTLTAQSADEVTEIQIDYKFGTVRVESSEQVSWDWSVKCWAETEPLADQYVKQVKLLHSAEGGVHKFGVEIPEERSDLRGVKSNLTIRVPSNVKVVSTNRHGDTFVADRKADVKIDAAHGDATVETITGRCSIEVRHGELTAKNINFELANQSAEKNPDAPGNSSEQAASTESAAKVDDQSSKREPMLTIETAHTDVKLLDIGGTAKIDVQHGDLTGEIGADVQSTCSHADSKLVFHGDRLSWNGQHSDMNLTVTNSALESLDLATTHDDITVTLPKGMEASVTTSVSHGKVNSEFTSGNGVPVKLKASHGDITIRAK